MAKTNWQLNEIVMPADMNQIGTEINEKATKLNPVLDGVLELSNRVFTKILGNKQTIASSPNQKMKVYLANGFNGTFKISVYGGYNTINYTGVISKQFSGSLTSGSTTLISGKYSEVSPFNFLLSRDIQISDIKYDTGYYVEICYSSNDSNRHTFSIKLEILNGNSGSRNLIDSANLTEFTASSTTLPKAIKEEDQLQLTATQGTSPLVVTSTTKVENLNADYVNGIKFYKSLGEISLNNENVTMSLIVSALGINQGIIFNTNGINAPRIGLNSADRGVVEIYKASTTLIVAEFNSIKSNTSTTSKQGVFDSNGVFQNWVELSINGSPISSTQLTSTAPQGTAPLVVSSNTRIDNLNTELWNGWKIYSTYGSLGIPNTSTLQDILTALPTLSKLVVGISASNREGLLLNEDGVLEVTKLSSTRATALFTAFSGYTLEAKINNSLVFSGWTTTFNDPMINGIETLSYKWSRRVIGVGYSLANSPNQKMRISIPVVNFGGNIKLTVLGSYNTLNLNGIMEKSFTGNLIANRTFDGFSYYEKVFSTIEGVNGFWNHCQISDLQADSTGFYFEFCVSGSFAPHAFTFMIEAKGSTGVETQNLLKDVSLSTFYASSTTLPKAVVRERRIELSAPNGTPPLIIYSNTKVDNLNSDLLDDMHASSSKTANTIVSRKSDSGIEAGGFSSFEQIGVKLPGRNREVRITQDSSNISYIQLVNDSGGFISNPIQINADGTAGFNVSTNVISYTNPASPQVRNTHVGNTAPSNSLGINGDIYIEL